MADEEPCNVPARNRAESQPTTPMRREPIKPSLEQNEAFPDHRTQSTGRIPPFFLHLPVAGSSVFSVPDPLKQASQQASLQAVSHILSKPDMDHYVESKAIAVELEHELLVLNRNYEELITIIKEQNIKYESELYSELENQEQAIEALKKKHEEEVGSMTHRHKATCEAMHTRLCQSSVKCEKKEQALREQMSTKLQAWNALDLKRMRDSISVEDLREWFDRWAADMVERKREKIGNNAERSDAVTSQQG
ncbi:unnamed protein product [Alternaria alternata]